MHLGSAVNALIYTVELYIAKLIRLQKVFRMLVVVNKGCSFEWDHHLSLVHHFFAVQ